MGGPLGGPEFDLPTPTARLRPYAICCAARSGSTLLCDLLRRSGKMGVPEEYLNPEHLAAEMAPRLGAQSSDGTVVAATYLRELIRRRTTPNGVFGIKVLWSQAERWLPSSTFRGLMARSDLIWLRRRDVLAQAISLVIAQQTQVWHHRDAAGPRPEPFYDAEAIRRVLGAILSEEWAWGRFFEANQEQPTVVWYEDIVADPERVCGAICAAVGVAAGPFRIETRRLGGALNDQWARRWMDEIRVGRASPETAPRCVATA